MLKGTAVSIALSLTLQFDIGNSCFPNCWKKSSVVPIPKASAHDSPTNYRPISLLSIVSKLLEMHIHFLLTLHLDENDPISEQQWGYQQGKSTVIPVDHNTRLAEDSGILDESYVPYFF